jgi:hypothetical protein
MEFDVPKAAPAFDVALEVSSLDAAIGEVIAVTLRADEGLAALQGDISFDAARLSYRGQLVEGLPFTLVNDRHAADGRLILGSLDLDQNGGLGSRVAVLAFEVCGGEYTEGLRFEFTAGGTTDYEVLESVSIPPKVLAATNAPHVESAVRMTLRNWMSRYSAGVDGPRPVPGEYRSDLVYGDVALNGGVNIQDALCVVAMGTGAWELIKDTDADTFDDSDTPCPGAVGSTGSDAAFAANVWPFNDSDPDLEPGDEPQPSGEIVRIVNINDAQFILSGNHVPDGNPTGEAIPGRSAGDDWTAWPRSVITAGEYCGPNTWYAGTVYEIQGKVVIGGPSCPDVGNELTISAGARIEGLADQKAASAGARIEGLADQNPASTLVIDRRATVRVLGTAFQPVVMTCTGDPLTKQKGCWGGFYILGNALINSGFFLSPVITGRSQGYCRESAIHGNDDMKFGGCNPDDDSGEVHYLVVEWGGTASDLDCVTLAGVGRGTEIDHVQAHGGAADGIQILGGSVNMKYLLATYNSNDGFDFSFGWNGNAQHVIILHDPTDSDKGIDADNTEGEYFDFDLWPRTNPKLWNFTIVGRPDPANGGPGVSDGAIAVRAGARPDMHNFLVLNSYFGLDIHNPETCEAEFGDGSGGSGPSYDPTGDGTLGLDIQHSLFGGNHLLGRDDEDPTTCQGFETTAPYSWLENEFVPLRPGNEVYPNLDATDCLVNPFDEVLFDFRPIYGSTCAAVAGAIPNCTTCDSWATWRGAVAPATASKANTPWYAGWIRRPGRGT